MKGCSKCKQVLPLDHFFKASKEKSGLMYSCKECSTLTAVQSSQKARRSPAGRARYLVTNAKHRAKTFGLDFSLTNEWVEERLLKGTCEVTGLPFEFEAGNGRGKRSPWAPSLDQKNPSAGYTQENTQVVVLVYNLMKADYSEEVVKQLAGAIINGGATISPEPVEAAYREIEE